MLAESSSLLDVFRRAYRELRPRAPMPEFVAQFYKFAHINNTIRLREGRVLVRVSDLLEGAPEEVLHAIAHILLAKLYRKPIEPRLNGRYRRWVTRGEVTEKAHLIRQMRGRKTITTAQGEVYDLDEIFDGLNRRFFFGLMGKPQLTWSRHHGKRLLGHYDPAHNTIMISKAFDRPQVPRYAIDYLMYHEMLHLKHPVKTRGGRRCVHSAAFQEEERLFPELKPAVAFLKKL